MEPDVFKRVIRYNVEGADTRSFLDPLLAQQHFNAVCAVYPDRIYRLTRVVVDVIAVNGVALEAGN